jgi:hypothetical protein
VRSRQREESIFLGEPCIICVALVGRRPESLTQHFTEDEATRLGEEKKKAGSSRWWSGGLQGSDPRVQYA